ncbi:MAG TPA: hypothetical protein PKA62_07975, partial [Thermoanaerobaculia bacterium]|nr:hypothetical protein [Thermoanaerobaculia bacterium]
MPEPRDEARRTFAGEVERRSALSLSSASFASLTRFLVRISPLLDQRKDPVAVSLGVLEPLQ